jgi:hypothetical protein
MSTKPNLNAEDSRELALVLGLLAKTREGKIRWLKEGSAITAMIPVGLNVNFVLSTNVFTASSEWQLFTVRAAGKSELVRVANTPAFLGPLRGAIGAAIDELFQSVLSYFRDDLDSAIDSVKNL